MSYMLAEALTVAPDNFEYLLILDVVSNLTVPRTIADISRDVGRDTQVASENSIRLHAPDGSSTIESAVGFTETTTSDPMTYV
jgi:hypothetical protein